MVGVFGDGPGDAAVLRPILDSLEGVVVSHGICPRYSDLDTYAMVACAIDEALRNYLCVGGSLERLGGLDNFCWPDPVQSEKTPDGRYKLAQLVRANQALFDVMNVYGIPCISGKDSMKNDYKIGDTKISIPPTVLFSIVGRIPDIRQTVTMDAKQPGDVLYVLGVTRAELGGSEYFAHRGFVGNQVPRVEPEAFLGSYRALERAIRKGLVASCHDCSDGGLGVALAETAFSGDLGLDVDLRSIPRDGVERDDFLLFSESQGRFVITVSPEHEAPFQAQMAGHPLGKAGKVTDDSTLTIRGLEGTTVIHADVNALKAEWKKPLAGF
jgi:phosphoribosylformylglycinamidine synthase